ncbi:MAG: DUF4124 domain-containing protein [Candidatus Competibacteraceae bacterium]|nr:DUF4124 domain-containing protein [Candidatus Competibacteraceae bacterium]MBK9950231.1 DUF4124 domain-containing protein [Candidatus Competibacteraceae bacterium]
MNGLHKDGFDGLRYFLQFPPARQRAAGHSLAGRWPPLLLGAFLLILHSGSIVAEEGVYTWKDGSGRVHYSNRRPENQPVQAVELNAKPVVVQPTKQIYTWTDRQGKVHYGAKPPADMPAKELKENDSSLSTVPFNPLSVDNQDILQELQPRK